MKYNRLLLVLAAVTALFSSCKKYDLNNVHGIHLSGTTPLPIAHGSFSMMKMMERFQIDSLITCDASGNMTYNYRYERENAVSGSELLTFKDFETEEVVPINVQIPWFVPLPFDTTLHFTDTILLQSEHIHVLSALVKSGHIHGMISFEGGTVQVNRIIIHSAEFTNAQGSELWYEMPQDAQALDIDLAGMSYATNEFNTLHLDFSVGVTVQSAGPISDMHIELRITDMALSEMHGHIEPHSTKSKIFTEFNMFPDNVQGKMKISGAQVYLRMKNDFRLPARLVVDTALVSGPGIPSFDVFSIMPQVVEMDYNPDYVDIFHESIDVWMCAYGASAVATSDFTLNPDGLTEQVSVSDTCSVGVRADVEIPMAFVADEVHYLDTVNMRLSQIDSPQWIKQLTLELTLTSTIPLDMKGGFYMLNSEEGVVVDSLLDYSVLVAASYDGQPVTTTVVVEITEDRIQKVMQADRMILDFEVDTEAHDVQLKSNQNLDFFLKSKVVYDGNINFKNN